MTVTKNRKLTIDLKNKYTDEKSVWVIENGEDGIEYFTIDGERYIVENSNNDTWKLIGYVNRTVENRSTNYIKNVNIYLCSWARNASLSYNFENPYGHEDASHPHRYPDDIVTKYYTIVRMN